MGVTLLGPNFVGIGFEDAFDPRATWGHCEVVVLS